MPLLINNTNSKFGLITILFHWVMAVIVIGLFILGDYMTGLEPSDTWHQEAPKLHISFGVIVLILLMLRYFWKMIQITPSPFANYSVWELKLSKIVHWIFYILLLIACMSGYLVATADGGGADVFSFFTLDAMTTLTESQTEFVAEVHEIVTWMLVFFFVIHAGGALKHHYIDKDKTLIRMLNPFKD